MMVIGLYSGEQLIVQDKSFFITVGTSVKQVFLSEDGKRRFIVDENRIEFYNERNTQEYMDKIHESIQQTLKRTGEKVIGGDYV